MSDKQVPTPRSVKHIDLQVVEYGEAVELQEQLHEIMKREDGLHYLITCQHPPTITLGTSSQTGDLLVTEQALNARGVTVHTSSRGGQITYHGPGQLIFYPLLNLLHFKKDVGWYMRSLEEVVIRCLEEYNVSGVRVPGQTGVWLAGSRKKIASMGVRIRRWRTLHGVALNVLAVSKEGFNDIVPCGLPETVITTISDETPLPPTLLEVQKKILQHFQEVFEVKIDPSTSS